MKSKARAFTNGNPAIRSSPVKTGLPLLSGLETLAVAFFKQQTEKLL